MRDPAPSSESLQCEFLQLDGTGGLTMVVARVRSWVNFGASFFSLELCHGRETAARPAPPAGQCAQAGVTHLGRDHFREQKQTDK